MNPQAPRNHVPALDGLRGLAILLVMVHHATAIHPTGPLQSALVDVAHLGAHGVDLFFVLSGFLITSILLRSKGRANYLPNFYARRALRILPLYYLVLALALIALPWLMARVPGGPEKLARFGDAGGDWAWYVTFTSNWLVGRNGTWRHGVLDVTWSLAIEEQFYLLWPLLVRAFDLARLKQACCALVLTGLVARAALVVLVPENVLAPYVLTPCRVDVLAMGSLLAVARSSGEWERVVALVRRAGSVSCLLIASMLVVGATNYAHPMLLTVGLTAIALACTALVAIAIDSDHGPLNSFLRNPVLVWFGKVSFCLYLVHLPIRAVLRDWLFGGDGLPAVQGSNIVLWQFAFYVIAVVSPLPVAAVSWALIERPMLRLKDRFE